MSFTAAKKNWSYRFPEKRALRPMSSSPRACPSPDILASNFPESPRPHVPASPSPKSQVPSPTFQSPSPRPTFSHSPILGPYANKCPKSWNCSQQGIFKIGKKATFVIIYTVHHEYTVVRNKQMARNLCNKTSVTLIRLACALWSYNRANVFAITCYNSACVWSPEL